MKSVICDRHFHDEAAAYRFVETQVWPEGPVCPHCGGFNRISKMAGKSTRIGTYKCYQCRRPFTVKVGTIFEASHVPLRHWLQAMFLMASSKKGISANQLARTLGCTLKTGWFIGHRIREAMKQIGIVAPMGEGGGVVEMDETFFGRKQGRTPKAGSGHKYALVSLVERGGSVRSIHVDRVSRKNAEEIVAANVSREARLMTDKAAYYKRANFDVAEHKMIDHSIGQYRSGDCYTNTIESFYSTFKRGMKGTYQHCQEKHFHRYAAEFDFRYNNRTALGIDDVARTEAIVRGIIGKRLTYRTTN